MRFFRRAIAFGAIAVALGSPTILRAAADDVETVIFIRHGEKPDDPKGQLNCKGLNRSMMLPRVIDGIVAATGRPLGAIFAPNPAEQKEDGGGLYDYVRPLATIEPTAIKNNMPVSAYIGYANAEELAAVLKNRDYRGKVVLVAWEHKVINDVECRLLTDKSCHWGDDNRSGTVVKWPGDGPTAFDRIDLLEIDWSDNGKARLLPAQQQGLNDVSAACPWDK
jgi:hypothetical protein